MDGPLDRFYHPYCMIEIIQKTLMYPAKYPWQARRKRGAWGALAPQFLAEQLTLSQPGGADYARHSPTSPPGFSDLVTALHCKQIAPLQAL